VPFSLTGKAQFKVPGGYNASLADVAPTILHLMGIDVPTEMSGTSLVV